MGKIRIFAFAGALTSMVGAGGPSGKEEDGAEDDSGDIV